MTAVSVDGLLRSHRDLAGTAASWRARVAASSPVVRRLLAAAALASTAALVLIVLAVQAVRPVREAPQPPARMVTALLPDPLGCPTTIRCYDQLSAPPDLVQSFHTWFPGGIVLAGHATFSVLGADRYEAELIGRSGAAAVQLRTLCVPGGQSRSSQRTVTGGGVHLVVLEPARPGCTVAVTLDSPTPDGRLEAAAAAMAADPALQAGQ